MSTKVKGLLKGLRYISQIFDDEKEKQKEMEIGFPTDVKHVAHIGWDGPAVDSPSWMNDFKEEGGNPSAQMNHGGGKESHGSVSEVESSRKGRGQGEPKSTKSRLSANNSSESGSSKKEKSKQSKRDNSKESSDSAKPDRHVQDESGAQKGLFDIPKKSRRKKSKDCVGESSTRKSKGKNASTSLGIDSESSVRSYSSEPCQTSSSNHLQQKENKESSIF